MTAPQVVLDRAAIDRLIGVLSQQGYRVIGPVEYEQTISYGEVASSADFPIGRRDEQEAGRYRLLNRDDDALFGHVLPAASPITYLQPGEAVIWAGRRNGSKAFETVELEPPPRYAFIGVRPCELAAVAVQDRVFLGGGSQDAVYAARREGTFFVAVDCTEPGGTCFCDSMGTGPGATTGYDIALTEVLGENAHYFVARSGTEEGARVLAALGGRPAGDGETAEAEGRVAEAAEHMGRELDTDGLRDLLADAPDDPYWDEVAKRCLTCGNCTMVCPTCFCAAVENRTDLHATYAERVRRWDSCFNFEFSYIHGGPLRPSTSARYRHWMTHKLSSWVDQFGTFGCVGCGRCITWCPVGIDITRGAAAIRAGREAIHA